MHPLPLKSVSNWFSVTPSWVLILMVLLSCSELRAEESTALSVSAAATPACLRQDAPKTDAATQAVAVELSQQGWTYTMPVPKSKEAIWGNPDGRTTWWFGYWFNTKTNKYSDTDPKKDASGAYVGDDQIRKDFYRRGGSPGNPTSLEWLLSTVGGPVTN